MKTTGIPAMVAAGLLAACGPGDERADAPPPPPPANSEPDTAEAGRSAAPAMPPAPDFTRDGAVLEAAVGETVTLTLDLPDNVSTGVEWTVMEGAYEPVMAYQRTYRTLQGAMRYSEVMLEAREAGETTVTLAPLENGTPISDDRRTITFRVR